MRIQIYKGYVSHYKAGLPDVNTAISTIKFSIGDPPVKFSAWSLTGVSPLLYGGHFAIAGRPSLIPYSANVAVAYRRLGGGETAHSFNMVFPILYIIFAIGAGLLSLTFNIITTSDQLFNLAMLGLGLFGIWQIWSIRKALDMLNRLQDARPDH